MIRLNADVLDNIEILQSSLRLLSAKFSVRKHLPWVRNANLIKSGQFQLQSLLHLTSTIQLTYSQNCHAKLRCFYSLRLFRSVGPISQSDPRLDSSWLERRDGLSVSLAMFSYPTHPDIWQSRRNHLCQSSRSEASGHTQPLLYRRRRSQFHRCMYIFLEVNLSLSALTSIASMFEHSALTIL